MHEINQHTVAKVKHFILKILGDQLSQNFVFHSIGHTLDVLKNVEIIGKYENLSEDEMNILRISALLHDVGYTKTYNGHEEESAVIAEKYLKNEGFDDRIIHKITSAILATKIPQNPMDKLSEILADADLMHLTYDNYFEQIDFMRQEWELMGIATMNEYEFHINSLKFFNAHHYHSEYGKIVLDPLKKNNLERINLKIRQ